MNVAIIGASSAGLYTAIFLKKKHPDYQVEVFDKNEKVGRKLAATGNGRCNLLNLGDRARRL
jgi:predicted flavoprotein YhiN